MSDRNIHYIRLGVAIHGLDTTDEAIDVLTAALEKAAREALEKDPTLFNWRDAFESDLEVEFEEFSGGKK